MTDESIQIVKADGTKEPYMPMKLENSLLRAGASSEQTEEILSQIEGELEDQMTSKHIYDRALALLEERKRPAASKYSLRKAVMELGPTGFPFEDFVARIFEVLGYQTKTGVMLDGKCVKHEVDVVAYKDNELNLMEAKFHNDGGITSGVQTALYVKARFDDLSHNTFSEFGSRSFGKGWIVTNTKFTGDAIHFGECADLNMIGWNYPAKGNLQDLIEKTELQPMTALTSVPSNAKKHLLDNGVVLCRALQANEPAMRAAGLSDEEIKAIQQEVDDVCAVE